MRPNRSFPTVTSFFRDPDLFEALRHFVLPALLRRRHPEKKLTIWCAACSHGQEAYSIAILLREYFPTLLANWQFEFIATDISSTAIARARNGEYSTEEIARRLPEKYIRRYFTRRGEAWTVSPELRLLVEFNELDLCEDWSIVPKPIDLVFMRNVLIYYDRATRKHILDRMLSTLRPDGYLFLGATETIVSLGNIFEPVRFDKAIGYQARQSSA
ncbi:MAG: CheR family methyltransferase [Geitlerinemataceae cyanobacterium]